MVPCAGTGSGWAVAGIVIISGVAVIDGVPPGSVIRMTSSRFVELIVGPDDVAGVNSRVGRRGGLRAVRALSEGAADRPETR